MTGPTIHTPYRHASASKLLNALASSLAEIKDADGHTDAEIGGFLGKGADQGAKYRTALAEMPVTSFFRGCELWNGRFANEALALVGMKLVPLAAGDMADRSSLSALTRLLFEMSVALEDGEIDPGELAAMHAAIEAAGQAIDRMRERLSLRAA